MNQAHPRRDRRETLLMDESGPERDGPYGRSSVSCDVAITFLVLERMDRLRSDATGFLIKIFV